MSHPSRAGRYIQQSTGYRAFIPEPLPPDPPVQMDLELTKGLSDADRALGRLDGVASILPNPNLFVAMYVRQEAVLSSQIEGTQSTLEDVLQFEARGGSRKDRRRSLEMDVEEVVNYVDAMNFGLSRVADLPLSLRLLREIHGRLLQGVRGERRNPGEFRRTQNWIGPADSTLKTAQFVPPPPHEMHQFLDNLEKYLHNTDVPTLLLCGLAHAQFETIHPFLDGNGRIGRLLITFLLCERQVLAQPLLYLSHYLKAHRAEYFDRLMAIRNQGDWESWLKFFLQGVYLTSHAATRRARAILGLLEQHRQTVNQYLPGRHNGLRLLDYLFEQPIISVRMAENHLGCAYATAGKLVEEFERLEIVRESTGQKRHRQYRFVSYLDLFRDQD